MYLLINLKWHLNYGVKGTICPHICFVLKYILLIICNNRRNSFQLFSLTRGRRELDSPKEASLLVHLVILGLSASGFFFSFFFLMWESNLRSWILGVLFILYQPLFFSFGDQILRVALEP